MTAAVRYRKREVLDFIERHIRRSTSERASTMIAAESAALRRMQRCRYPVS